MTILVVVLDGDVRALVKHILEGPECHVLAAANSVRGIRRRKLGRDRSTADRTCSFVRRSLDRRATPLGQAGPAGPLLHRLVWPCRLHGAGGGDDSEKAVYARRSSPTRSRLSSGPTPSYDSARMPSCSRRSCATSRAFRARRARLRPRGRSHRATASGSGEQRSPGRGRQHPQPARE